jgi:hypothetical protein
MTDKVRTAAEIAEEHARNRMEGKEVTPVEIDFENVTVTKQDKLESHVINQDEETGFDENKKSERFQSDKQSFSRIKNIYAEGPAVVIEVDEGKIDVKTQAAILGSKKVTPSEALQRATALNAMLAHDKVVLADRKQVEEIIQQTIEATLEAQENTMTANGATYEDIKRTRKARLDRIEQFEKAVEKTRGKKDLQELQQMMMFKKVLKKLAH